MDTERSKNSFNRKRLLAMLMSFISFTLLQIEIVSVGDLDLVAFSMRPQAEYPGFSRG
jgi:hypothetical protein